MPTYSANIVSDISTYIQTIYEMSMMAARDYNFVTNLVSTFNDNSGTAARTRSEYGTVTYNQISDADELSSQQFKPSTDSTITPAFFGAQFFITDRRRRSSPIEQAQNAANELGLGAAKKIQQDILANMSSLTGGTVGSAGGTVTWGNIFAAVAKLRQQNAPPPYYGVIQSGQWYHLGTAVVPAGAQTNAPVFQDKVMNMRFVGSFFDTLWFETNDIASGTAAVGGVFSRQALAFDVRKGFGIEPQRDASRGGGGWELNATMEYAQGVWRPKFGVQIIATSVVP